MTKGVAARAIVCYVDVRLVVAAASLEVPHWQA